MFKSNAEWPKQFTNLETMTNISTEEHNSFDEAFFTCCELEYNGNPSIEGLKPIRVWVTNESGETKWTN